jgi:colicin import membrane protein
MSQVQAAIKGHLYDWDTYAGKTCTLRVKIAEDGTLLSVAQEGGDPAFCQAMLAATNRMSKFPKPPTAEVYKVFRNVPLDFKP